MKPGDDLGARGIYAKAVGFVVILLTASVLLVLEERRLWRISLVLLVIWSAARLYYFMFYVIEKYVDPSFRFSGILDFLRYLLRRHP